MKFYKKIILLCFSLSIFYIRAQEERASLSVSYRLEILNDTINKNSVPVDFTLLCNDKASIYFSEEAKEYYEKIRERKEYYFLTPPKSKSSVYKSGDNLLVTLPIGNDLFTYKEPRLDWEIIDAPAKKILNYDVKLAKVTTDTNQIFYAWFAPNIEISEGPFRFKGLPGLVLEVYNHSKLIHFYATAIENSDALIEPIQYTETFQVEKKAFLKKRKEYIENPQPTYSSFIITNDPPSKRKPLNINPNTLLD